MGQGRQRGYLGRLRAMTMQVPGWGSEMPLSAPSYPPPQKLIQTTRNEVNSCFSEIMQEVKHLQMKVLDFVDKEEAAALGKLGSSIQQSHNRLLKLEGDSIWLRTLLTNRSDQQFLQARPHPTPPPPQLLSQPLLLLHPQTHQKGPDLGLSNQGLRWPQGVPVPGLPS